MKLNTKRTVCVGFAFFLIIIFWQAYDTIIPKILTDKFGMPQSLSGVVMALDNILALFLLPLFGSLSDKTKSKRGKRTPYIFFGTLVAAVLVICLAFFDGAQANVLPKLFDENNEAALTEIYDADLEIEVEDPDRGFFESFFTKKEKKPLKEIISKEDFTAIEMKDKDGKLTEGYSNYVVPARQAYANEYTTSHPTNFIFFASILLLLLVAMGTFRSPAVALMPDVTPKPLRSKGNAIINLMGAVGGIIVLAVSLVLGTGKPENAVMPYFTFFLIISILMVVSLVIFMCTVKEPQFVEDAEKQNALLEAESHDEPEQPSGEKKKLSKGEKRSLILILMSVALWYMGYNAIISKYSVYAGEILKMDYSLPLMLAQGIAILTFIPAGILATKIGRKKSILIGVGMLATAFLAGTFMTDTSPYFLVICLFGLAGMGWATINVSSFPMVVELAGKDNVGKYTGYYYTASMAAQTITPVLSGVFLDINMKTFFPYATIFVVLSFITMLFVRHGDSKPLPKKDILEHLDNGD